VVKTYFHVPRIVYSETDPPERQTNRLKAYVSRWLAIITMRRCGMVKVQAEAEAAFTSALVAAGNKLFVDYIESNLDPERLKQTLAGGQALDGKLRPTKIKG